MLHWGYFAFIYFIQVLALLTVTSSLGRLNTILGEVQQSLFGPNAILRAPANEFTKPILKEIQDNMAPMYASLRSQSKTVGTIFILMCLSLVTYFLKMEVWMVPFYASIGMTLYSIYAVPRIAKMRAWLFQKVTSIQMITSAETIKEIMYSSDANLNLDLEYRSNLQLADVEDLTSDNINIK